MVDMVLVIGLGVVVSWACIFVIAWVLKDQYKRWKKVYEVVTLASKKGSDDEESADDGTTMRFLAMTITDSTQGITTRERTYQAKGKNMKESQQGIRFLRGVK